ncbi:hypothetical protein BJ165DRAFT_1530524 [Panaeolus papilionaceus]|nr:hypothetical protein BJ165DRAFT_1530524 [Panaeolus papilionaceus]
MPQLGVDHPVYHRVPWPDHFRQSQETCIDLPSSFIDLLGHNNPLSSEGASFVADFEEMISQNLFNNAKRRVEVTRQIRMLQDELSELNLDRERFEKQTFVCKIITSPFRRLPNDIIYNIIPHCVRLQPADFHTSAPHHHIPTILSQVSSIWRTSTLGRSALWRQMHLDCGEWNRQPREVRRRINLFSERSSPRGLNLGLFARYESSAEHFQAVLKWILHHWPKSNSLEGMILQPVGPMMMVRVLREFSLVGRFKFESLETRFFDWDDFEPEPIVNWQALTSMLNPFPHLQHLWLSYHEMFRFQDITRLSSAILASWAQLTILYLNNAFQDVAELHSVLRACSSLKAARLRVVTHDTTPNTTRSTAVGAKLIHHHLEWLFLLVEDSMGLGIEEASIEEAPCSMIFVGTKFPKLTALHMYFDNDGDNVLDNIVYRFPGCLKGVFPVLEELYIPPPWPSVPASWASLDPLFLAVPTITKLSHVLDPNLLLGFQSFLQDNCSPFSRLARLSIKFPVHGCCWVAKDSEGALSRALMAIRRWQLSTLGETTAFASHDGTKVAKETSLNICFAWLGDMKDIMSSMTMADVNEFVENLQESCREEGLNINVELADNEPDEFDGMSGSQLFRDLYFTR